MQYGKQTDVGCVREKNEDAIAIKVLAPNIDLIMVADGMGGHRGGQIASQLALEVVSEYMSNGDISPTNIQQAIQEANLRIFKMSEMQEECAGMGTTLVLAIIQPKNILIANVGDSRAYHYQQAKKKLYQVTKDHSLAQELLQTGELTAETVKTFPLRNVITRAVGTEPTIDVDFFEVDWLLGDSILLCSDGLTGEICDEILLKKISSQTSAQTTCDDLVKMARHAGGRDNITVLIAKNTEDGGCP